MITMTFTLKNREKTITKETMQECIETFVKEYEEAENEIKSIRIDQIGKPDEYFIVSGKQKRFLTCCTMLWHNLDFIYFLKFKKMWELTRRRVHKV